MKVLSDGRTLCSNISSTKAKQSGEHSLKVLDRDKNLTPIYEVGQIQDVGRVVQCRL